MAPAPSPDRPGTDERRRQERAVWWWAMGLSVAVHVGVFLFWPATHLSVPTLVMADSAARAAAAGGGSIELVRLEASRPQVLIPPPQPIVTTEPVLEVEFDDDVRVEPTEVSGVGLADLAPPGATAGRGSTPGGTGAGGDGSSAMTPPTPRAMILPTFAAELRDRGAEVWVWVDARGRVVPDSTRLQPPTSDRALNRRLREEAADWRFEPARRDGEPVASWYSYRVRTGGG